MINFKIYLVYMLLYLRYSATGQHYKFTNVKCTDYNKTYSSTSLCEQNVVKRDTVTLNINNTLHIKPMTQVRVHVQLFKKANGYHPYLVNITTDFCEFMKNKARVPYLRVTFNTFMKYANVNHTCPYNHGIVVKDLILTNDMFQRFPLLAGDYLFTIQVIPHKDPTFNVKVYFTVKE